MYSFFSENLVMKINLFLRRGFALLAGMLLVWFLLPVKNSDAAQQTPLLPGQFAYVEGGDRLFLVHGAVDQAVLLTQASQEFAVSSPQFSRDGRFLAYCLQDLQAGDTAAIHYLDTLTFEEQTVTEDGSCSYDWSPDGKRLVYSSPGIMGLEPLNGHGIWSYALETDTLERLIASETALVDPRWSPDGEMLSYFEFCFECVGQFYTYDLSTGETRAWSQAGTEDYIGPDVDWSPDGRRLVFDKAIWIYTGEGETYGLHIASRDGSGRMQIHSLPGRAAYFPLWSRDGSRIAFASFESFIIGNYLNRRGDLMTVAPDGSEVRALYSSSFEVFPQAWSPDGRYLLFVEALTVMQDPLARQQLVLLDAETGTPLWKVDTRGSIQADWAPLPVIEEPTVPATVVEEMGPTSVAVPTVVASGPVELQDDVPGQRFSSFLLPLLAGVVLLLGVAAAGYLTWKRSVLARVENLVVAEPELEEKPIADEQIPAPSAEEVQAVFQQGVELVRAGKADEGIAELQKVIAAAPVNADAWFWLAIASVRQKSYRTAERCFLQAKRHGHPEADKALDWLRKQT
jgi:Tol biopolymer transport system component